MKNFKPAQNQIETARCLVMAKAYTATIRPIVEDYKNEVLARHQFTNKKDLEMAAKNPARWGDIQVEVILDPEHCYRMSDEDASICFAEFHEARIKSGLYVDNPEHCPLLVAKQLEVQAERAFIDAMEPSTKISADQALGSRNGWENYKKLLEISLKLMVQFIPRSSLTA